MHKSEGTGLERLLDIRKFLTEEIQFIRKNYELVSIAMEGYAYESYRATMSGELGGLIKITLYDLFTLDEQVIPVFIVPPTILKKYVSGRGNAKKQDVMLDVYKRWGVEIRDDNLADAYVLARIASGESKTAFQEEALKKITTWWD